MPNASASGQRSILQHLTRCDFSFIGALTGTGNSVVSAFIRINEACHDSKARNFQSLKVKVRLILVSHLK